jgi:hypothetical protein
MRIPVRAPLVVAIAVSCCWGCGHVSAAAPPADKPAADQAITPAGAADRLPPPEVLPVERDGVRYAQAEDGRKSGQTQEHGVLVALDAASGKRLWSLVVYPERPASGVEADRQWIFFKSMSFDADGRLRITNEADETFLVDVKLRTVTPQRG